MNPAMDFKDFEAKLCDIFFWILRPYTWWVGGCQHLSFCAEKNGSLQKNSVTSEAVTHENLTQVLELTVMTLEWASKWGEDDEDVR